MFGFFKKLFKKVGLEVEYNTEKRMLDEAFAQLEGKKSYFSAMHRMYEAKYSEEMLATLKRNRYNTIYVPLVRNIVNTITGHFNTAFFSGKNPIEIRPVLADYNNEVQGMNRLLQYYYEICNPQEELLKAIRGAMVYGFACVHIYWDSNKQKVVTKYLPIHQVALDPGALSLQDAQYMCVKLENTLEYWQECFGEKMQGLFSSKKPTDIIEMKEIYIKRLRCYEKRSFIQNVCVDSMEVSSLPYCYGYALQKLPPPDVSFSKELMWLGDCLPRLLGAMQNEINKKRNLKMDIDELKLNPKGVYTEGFPTEILQQGAGAIACAPMGAKFEPITFGTDLNIAFDIELINKEAEEASGANSIHMGRTNPSDRRSATSLAIINSSSSVRIEEMIATINNTLFEHWAKRFVTLVKDNAPLDIRVALQSDFNGDIATTLKVNFGSSFAIDKRIASLGNILQIASQNPNINPVIIQNLLEEILTLELGDGYDVKEMFSNTNQEELQERSKGVL